MREGATCLPSLAAWAVARASTQRRLRCNRDCLVPHRCRFLLFKWLLRAWIEMAGATFRNCVRPGAAYEGAHKLGSEAALRRCTTRLNAQGPPTRVHNPGQLGGLKGRVPPAASLYNPIPDTLPWLQGGSMSCPWPPEGAGRAAGRAKLANVTADSCGVLTCYSACAARGAEMCVGARCKAASS